jgi:hypothetical protein
LEKSRRETSDETDDAEPLWLNCGRFSKAVRLGSAPTD